MNVHQIIHRPRITEKSVYLQNDHHTYTFEVHPDANKSEIKKAIETLFKVKVSAVNTQNCRGKFRRVRGRQQGITAAWKKAMVTLVDGQSIEGI